jgi:hypothetical protein
MGLRGLWLGWLLGLLASSAVLGYKLFGKELLNVEKKKEIRI